MSIRVSRKCAKCPQWFNGKFEDTLCPTCQKKDTNMYDRSVEEVKVDRFLISAMADNRCWFIANYMLFVNRIWTFCNDMVKGVIPNDRPLVSMKDKMNYAEHFLKFFNDSYLVFWTTIEFPESFDIANFRKINNKDLSDMDKLIKKYYEELGLDHDAHIKILLKLKTVSDGFDDMLSEYNKTLKDSPESLKWNFLENKIPKFYKETF